MNENVCPQCGAPLSPGATECKYCGEKIIQQQPQAQPAPNPQSPYPQQPYPQQPYQPPMGISPDWPVKSKVAAGLLGILFGGLGIHKFYLGKIGSGIVYLLFCWTFIPSIVGFIEGIIYLCSSDENFQLKNHVRVI